MLINNRIVKFAIYFTYHSRQMHYVFKNIRMIILMHFTIGFEGFSNPQNTFKNILWVEFKVVLSI